MNKKGKGLDHEAFQQRVQAIDHKRSVVFDEKGRVLRW